MRVGILANSGLIGDAMTAHRQEPHTLVIEPRSSFHLLDLRELGEYRDLLFYLTWREIAVRYKQSVLGYVWAFLQPLTKVLVYTVIFGVLLNVPSGGVPYPLFALAGIIAWTYFTSGMQQGADSLVAQQAVITKVYFPRILVPLTPCLAFLVDFAIALGLTLVATLVWTHRLHPAIVWLPFWILLMVLTTIGAALLFSALNVRYRDVRQGMSLVLQLGMYVTPIVWPLSELQHKAPRWYWLIGINPLASVAQGFRQSLLGQDPVPVRMLVTSIVATAVLLFVGLWYFHRTEDAVADIV